MALLFESLARLVGHGEKFAIKLLELRQHPLGGNANAMLATRGTDHAKGEALLVGAADLGHVRQATANQSAWSSKRFTSSPMPGIEITISQPGFMVRAPTEVPQQIRSPGSSVW